jgi:tripartite-type tricarboxylate transporter receptor subunit TctC
MPSNLSAVARRSVVLAAALLASTAALAQGAAYPAQPIRLVVPFPPAGGTDVVSRVVANEVTQATQWAFVLDNRPGAGGNIGLDLVAKAKNDGYTLGTGQTSNLAINPALYEKMPFDAMKDFAPVALLATQPLVLVVKADSAIKTVADVKAHAVKQTLNMASPGNGTVGHLTGVMFANEAGFKLTHVPYKGAGPALTDLLGGQTDIYFGTPASVLPMVRAGKLRAVAVTSAKRMPLLPETPTIAESGYPKFVAEDWKAVVAPAGTPKDVIAKLNKAFNAALTKPEAVTRMQDEGSTPKPGTPEQLGAFMKAEYTRWGAAVKASGAKAE